MSASSAAAVVIACAAALALWGSARRHHSWRHGVVWAQLLLAASFYLLLFPPRTELRGDALTVLTPGATPHQRRALPRAQPVVALPQADAPAGAERVPDLATALRRHGGVRSLTIVGDGLPARDQGAATGLGLRFDAAPERGVVELESPVRVLVGTRLALRGRVAGPAQTVELIDPSGAVTDSAPVRPDGGFALSALARARGPARFELRALDAHRAVLDRASVPIVIGDGSALSVIVRAGTPSPELKYLRRWMSDAGLAVSLSTGLSEGVTLHAGDTRLTPEALAAADLLVIDERAWTALAEDEKAALDAAIGDGLGLLLRVSGPVEDAVAAEWAAYGYDVAALDAPRVVTFDRRLSAKDRSAFTAAPARVAARGATPMLAADDGEVLAWWRARGAGRVGLWSVTDSYRLVLLGEPARYGTLWSESLAAIARARPAEHEPRLPADAWVDERAVFCELGAAAQARATDGVDVELIVDARGCAAYWPAVSGWHELRTGGASSSFYVRAAGDGEGLRSARDARATRSLERPGDPGASVAGRAVPMSRWPFFAAWLFVAGGLWWRERAA